MDFLKRKSKIKAALMSVTAAVVGLLIAAFYRPIWSSSIVAPIDFVFAVVLFSMLVFWKLPPLIVVITGAIGCIFLG